MKPLRFLLMTAALLALATNVHAQKPDPDLRIPYVPGYDAASGTPETSTWLMPYLQQAVQKVQQLHSLCTGQSCSGGACWSVGLNMTGGCKVGTCCTGTAGCAKSCELTQAPKACCCAKACACCETCKAKKNETVQAPTCPACPAYPPPVAICPAGRYAPPPPATAPMAIAWQHGCPAMPPAPPLPSQIVQIHGMPHAPMMPPPLPGHIVQIHAMPLPVPQAIRVVACTASTPAVKHAHLVTPDLEAHAARMTHRGDMIILEGDVMLLCKKHAQPIRIEAQRVIVNMKDGTFTVDAEARTVSTSGFGVQRTSALPAQAICTGRFMLGAGVNGVVLNERNLGCGNTTVTCGRLNDDCGALAMSDIVRTPSSKTVVLTLKNIDAMQAAMAVQRLLPGVIVNVDARTNSIIVTGTR